MIWRSSWSCALPILVEEGKGYIINKELPERCLGFFFFTYLCPLHTGNN